MAKYILNVERREARIRTALSETLVTVYAENFDAAVRKAKALLPKPEQAVHYVFYAREVYDYASGGAIDIRPPYVVPSSVPAQPPYYGYLEQPYMPTVTSYNDTPGGAK